MSTRKSKERLNWFAWLITLVGVSSASLAVERQLEFKPGFNLFSPAQDIEEGQKAAAQIDKQVPLLNDAASLNYINNLGRRLAGFAPNNHDYPFAFKVVNTGEINAFALPGGFIYVNRGAIEAAQDEAQLAGVMAHETGHVVMRHATHQASEMIVPELGLSVLDSVLGRAGMLGRAVAQAGGFGFQSILLKNSRGAESQADAVGAYILYQAGYDPHALAQFFQIIEQKYPQQTIQFLSNHPNPGNRIKAVDAEIPTLGPELKWKEDSPEFQQIKSHIKSLPPPPKQAAVQGAAPPAAQPSGTPPAPSLSYLTYQGSGFVLSYPDNWQVYSNQNSNAVIGPPGAAWGGGQGSVQAYGVSISIYQPANQGSNWKLDDATTQLVKSFQKSNPNMRVGNQGRLTVSGRPTLSTILENDSPLQGKKEIDDLVTLRTGNSLLAITFIAPEESYPSYKPTFEEMLRSLQIR